MTKPTRDKPIPCPKLDEGCFNPNCKIGHCLYNDSVEPQVDLGIEQLVAHIQRWDTQK